MYCIGNGQTNQAMSEMVGALNCMHDQQAVLIEREREREWRHPSEDLLNVNVNASRVFQTIGQTLGNGQTLRVSYTKKVLRVRDISHLATQLQRRFGSISPEGSALNMNET